MVWTPHKILLTTALLEAAQVRADALPIFQNSHRKKQANIVGCIGEIAFESFLLQNNIPFEDCRDTTTHDYLIGEKRFSLDLKTKDRTVKPEPFHDNSVPLYNHEHQRPSYYFFVSLYRDRRSAIEDIRRFEAAYLVGGIDIDTLDREGRRWNAGDVDPDNRTKFWTACLNVNMEKLLTCEQMLKIFRGDAVT